MNSVYMYLKTESTVEESLASGGVTNLIKLRSFGVVVGMQC